MTARIDVSIVAFRSRADIAPCIERALSIPGVGTVIVVDHGDDGSGDIARGLGADVIGDPTNPGFGAGHNRAVARLRAPYVLLLNPDALVEPNAVVGGADLLDEHVDIAAVQGVILGRDGRPERSQGVPLGPQHLLGRALGARSLLRSRTVRKVAGLLAPVRDHVERAPLAAVDTDSLAATAILVRREAFCAVGGFDERFFLYGEDVDLCRRLRANGGRLVALPAAWASHRSGGSFGSTWDRELQWWCGSMRYAGMSWTDAAWRVAQGAATLASLRLMATRPTHGRVAWQSIVRASSRARATRRVDARCAPSSQQRCGAVAEAVIPSVDLTEDRTGVESMRFKVARTVGHALYPRVRGGATIASRIFPVQQHAGPRVQARLRDGSLVMVSPAQYLEWSALVLGAWEPQIAREVARILSPGDGVIDAGANIGLHTLPIAALVGPTGLVVAFEASDGVADHLEQNIGLNRLENISVIRAAVSSSSGRAAFRRPHEDDHDAGHGALARPGDASSDCVEVDLATIDEAWPKHRPLRLIKIDVEGQEVEVLRGARETVRRFQPYVIFEYEPELWKGAGNAWSDAVAALGPGYRLSTLPLRGRPVPLCGAPDAACNVLAAPD